MRILRCSKWIVSTFFNVEGGQRGHEGTPRERRGRKEVPVCGGGKSLLTSGVLMMPTSEDAAALSGMALVYDTDRILGLPTSSVDFAIVTTVAGTCAAILKGIEVDLCRLGKRHNKTLLELFLILIFTNGHARMRCPNLPSTECARHVFVPT